MKTSSLFKIFLMLFFVIPFIKLGHTNEVSDPILTIEIYADGDIKRIDFQSDDIERVGINERPCDTRLEITFVPRFHSVIKGLTEENKGKRAVIRVGGETIFSGIIRETIRGGKIGPSFSSAGHARTIIEKMGREPDYHLKLTPKEIEASKRYTEPPKNPWAKKTLDAITIYHDYENAEKFAKKAIESDPDEPQYHIILGSIYYKQGKKIFALEEALTTERLSNEEDLKRFPGTYLSIADLYAHFNEYDKAIEYYQRVLSVYKDNFLAHLILAEVYESMGKTDLALKEYLLFSESDNENIKKKGLEGIRRLRKETE